MTQDKFPSDVNPPNLPLLPLRNAVLFPGSVLPLPVGRPKTLAAVDAAQAGDGLIGLVTQKNASTDDPGYDDLYEAGTVAQIMKTIDRGGQSSPTRSTRR
jgi:ATP-dependent Lon protease